MPHGMFSTMIESRLNYVMCPGAARAVPGGEDGVTQHRVGYWEWNQTGQVDHPHVIVCVHGLTRQGRDFDVLAQALSHQAVQCQRAGVQIGMGWHEKEYA